jgi:hypothetical protein
MIHNTTNRTIVALTEAAKEPNSKAKAKREKTGILLNITGSFVVGMGNKNMFRSSSFVCDRASKLVSGSRRCH